MRFGILADIHGNLPALEAVLDVLAGEDVDAYLCAGDLVGYGPFPNECVEVIRSLDVVCVAGNHDLIAVDLLAADRCSALARTSLEWTRHVLSEGARSYLANLPSVTTLDGIVVAHGSLDDPEEYTRTAEQAVAQLDRLSVRSPVGTLLVLGHTHFPWAFSRSSGALVPSRDGSVMLPPGDELLLNPGSVGQSRERRARARCVVLDLGTGRAKFLAVRFDIRRCRRALRRAGLPRTSLHPVPGLVARAWGRLRRRARFLRSRDRR